MMKRKLNTNVVSVYCRTADLLAEGVSFCCSCFSGMKCMINRLFEYDLYQLILR